MSLFTTSLCRLVVLGMVLTTAMAQSCYSPDGSLSKDVPCSTGSGESSCCGADEYCMNNGLCFGAGLFSRGTCTDKTWGSEACAGFCRTGESYQDTASGVQMATRICDEIPEKLTMSQKTKTTYLPAQCLQETPTKPSPAASTQPPAQTHSQPSPSQQTQPSSSAPLNSPTSPTAPTPAKPTPPQP